jgi:Uma2 family endonuclease
MSAMPERERWTVEDYLEFEQTAELRHEFFNGQVYAMVGASRRHTQISGAIHYSLFGQLIERDCEVSQSETRVRVSEKAYFYPDLVIVCGEANYVEKSEMTLLNPTVVIEILSPSTEAFDRGRKFVAYQGIESLQEYMLVTQDKMLVEHFFRQSDGRWIYTSYKQAESTIKLPSIDCTLALADIYRRVSFDDETSSE